MSLSLRWGVSGGGPQDASQHLVVVEGLVFFGGVTGPSVCCVGIREAQHPKAVGGQHQISLLWVENRAGRGARLHLKTQQSKD